MMIMDKEQCEAFRDYFRYIFDIINMEFEKETGEKLKEYKDYEPELLLKFCRDYTDEKEVLGQASKLLSKLIVLQALPKANHRTSFRLVDSYLCFMGNMTITTYPDAKELYDEFYDVSKHLISREISHKDLFNENFMDVHHTMALDKHLAQSKRLIEKILINQSGMMEAVPFQCFIDSLNHSGS